MTRIVIAGGGLAAQRCAETLRALGHDGAPVAAGGRTALADVFAAGDCAIPAGRSAAAGHWEAAARQGAAAARAMLGLPPRPEGPPLVWSDQHGVRVHKLGDPRDADRARREGGLGDFAITYERAGRPVATVLVNRPGAVGAARRRLQHAIPIKEAA